MTSWTSGLEGRGPRTVAIVLGLLALAPTAAVAGTPPPTDLRLPLPGPLRDADDARKRARGLALPKLDPSLKLSPAARDDPDATTPSPIADPLPQSEPDGGSPEELPEEKSYWQRLAEEDDGKPIDRDYKSYEDFLVGELRRVNRLDIYGVSGQLPQGYLSIQYTWTSITAGSRYNNLGELGPVMTPIKFTAGDQTVLDIDLGLNGTGQGHGFMVSYGILDELDWYIEIPLTQMNVRFDPEMRDVDGQGNKIAPSYAGLLGIEDPQSYTPGEFLYDALPRLGRPTPATKFESRLLLGDVNTGFSWNYFRGKHFSASATARVVLPTAEMPNPNNNLTYGTGPRLETGLGGWAVGMTHGMDVRFFQWKFLGLVLSNEVTWSYGFKQNRPYPTNFVPPDPAYQALDPAAFPDLSDLDGTFEWTPGFAISWATQLNLGLGPASVGVGFGVQHAQEPWLEATGEQGERFLSMARSLELLGQNTAMILQVGAQVNLLPLYIPAALTFSWQKVVGGRNTIVFDDYIQVGVQGFLPMFMLWE